MNYTEKPYQRISASGEVAERRYEKIESTKNNYTYYVIEGRNDPESILVDTKDPNSQGFAGRIIPIKLVDGSVDEVKGPWSTNCDALFSHTGVDLRDKHRTFVVLGMGRYSTEDGGYRTIITDVIYQDPEGGLVGCYDRYKELEKQYPEALTYLMSSRGGGSSGPTKAGYEKIKRERELQNQSR